MTPDPLCRSHRHGLGVDGCFCAELRTARLQGPVSVTPGHPAICWCARCYRATA